MFKAEILKTILELKADEGVDFIAPGETVEVKLDDNGIIIIGSIPYTSDAAVNIVDAIKPHTIYPTIEVPHV